MTEHTDRVIAEIAAERRRQIEAEGFHVDHDDEHGAGELAAAAACYALEGSASDWDSAFPRTELPDGVPVAWPWEPPWWKPRSNRENLVRAAALIVAEIERIDRNPEPPHE